jgi:hypothetical protein
MPPICRLAHDLSFLAVFAGLVLATLLLCRLLAPPPIDLEHDRARCRLCVKSDLAGR